MNARTKAAMLESITGMIRSGSGKDARDLKSKVIDLTIMVKKYRERTSEEPGDELLGSILSNLLDP